MTELNKLNLKSLDGTSENIVKIEKLFPNCITESKDENGNLKKSINFDVLKQLLSKDIAEGREYYEFTWPGKKAAILEANSPITKTLRPCKEESKDWLNTKNLYIEGDNLEALKILQESYLGKVKMIYIDPPYNTGNDFVYKDDFSQSEANYSDSVGQKNECGEKLFKNTESNGRFHSDWCSMIYSRLLSARKILSEDGAIFISIDENEVANLRKIADSVFGEANFISNLIWQSRTSISNDHEISLNHNHTLVYSKSRENLIFGGDSINKDEYKNPDNDPRGPWKLVPIDANHVGGNTVYPIKNPKNGKEYMPPNGRIWSYNKETFEHLLKDGRIKFGISDNSSPKRKLFLNERTEKGDTKTPSSILSDLTLLDVGTTKNGTTEIMSLFENQKIFDYPKPVSLIKKLLQYGTCQNSIVLDFFSGSATTAHAVMKLNAEDGGNRQFIMVQIPEKCDEKTEAFKAGYKNICEIGKERIRRVGEQIKKDHPDSKVDIGFRVFKVDSSNMKDVYYNPEKLNQDLLSSLESNVKEDRTDYDLLFSTILDLGLTLDKEVKEETIGNTKVYIYNDDEKEGPDLIACFADNITEDVITAIAKRNPLKAVFKDSSFENSPSKINLFELFKTYANISDDKELQSRVKVI